MAERDIRTLIKMHKLRADEQRRALAAKQAEADTLMAAIAALQAEVELEKQQAAAGKEGAYAFGTYVTHKLHREEQLQQQLSQKEREVMLEREKLAVIFEELKRYEIAQENWDKEHEEMLNRREVQVYDEQAGQRHEKKRKEK
jgi:hypothetical protein